ncbi:MAG: hypothetical protein PUF37_05830 [Prevotellaceae bacterium]|nr:hypothetical protein [Prevotellaceae bacterium]
MQFLKTTNGKIILLSILGFFFTGILCYPYSAWWDSDYVLTRMVNDGQPWLTNWMGWYLPWLCQILYKLTGCFLAIGVFQNLIYWTGITILSISLFNRSKHPIVWYLLVAWFPGSLAFISGIANNEILFAYILLGVALFAFYKRVYRHSWLFWLSEFFLLQTIFIRREAIIYIVPIMIAFAYIWLYERYGKKLRTLLVSIVAPIVLVIALLIIEKGLTAPIPGYQHINTIDYTAMFDMEGMSFYKGQVVFPMSVFKKQYRSPEFLMNKVRKDEPNLESDVFLFWRDTTIIVAKKPVLIKVGNFIPIYLHNIKYYLKFRGNMFVNYMLSHDRFAYDMDKSNIINSPIKEYSLLQIKLGYLVSSFGLPVFYYCLLALSLLCLSIFRYIPYESRKEAFLCSVSVPFLLAVILLYTISSVAVQTRYVYPSCLFLWYLSIYMISLFVDRNKFVRVIWKKK